MPTELWNEDFTKYSLLNPIVQDNQYDKAALFLVEKQFCTNITNVTITQNQELFTKTAYTDTPPTTPPTAILILMNQPMLLNFDGRRYFFNANFEIHSYHRYQNKDLQYQYLDLDLKEFRSRMSL